MGESSPQITEALQEVGVEGDGQYLTFSVSGESYAVDVVVIQEIIEVGSMTDLPMAPDFIRGVVSLRGAGLPVVDISIRLGQQKKEITSRSCIVVVDMKSGPSRAVGMLVDEVNEIMEIAPDLVQPTPDLGNQAKNDFIKGMGRIGDHFIVLLDTDYILSDEECRNIEHIAQQQPSGP